MTGIKSVRAVTAAGLVGLFSAGLFSAGLLLAAAGPAAALSEAEAESLYTDYQRSIKIYELCKDVELTAEEHSLVATEIDTRIEHRIGAKRLRLLTAAKREGEEMVDDMGCDHYDVRYYVRLFLSDLKPAMMQ